MKASLLSNLAAVSLLTVGAEQALAQDMPAPSPPPLIANGQFATQYVLRVISQTAGRPAVQSGLDYDTGIGITLGSWVSSRPALRLGRHFVELIDNHF